jgi:hypothetical protein
MAGTARSVNVLPPRKLRRRPWRQGFRVERDIYSTLGLFLPNENDNRHGHEKNQKHVVKTHQPDVDVNLVVHDGGDGRQQLFNTPLNVFFLKNGTDLFVSKHEKGRHHI